MREDRPLFILAGNGPYENRGCEAIVRGTVRILREFFDDPEFICLSHFQNEEQYRKQSLEETDDAITHLSSCRISKKKIIHNFWNPDTWRSVYNYFFRPDAFISGVYRGMLPDLDRASAVLSVGGDNYSLDYGLPTLFTGLDDLVIERGKPVIIWGASVGPFSEMPEYEHYMGDHLRKVTGIFARESVTVEYLKSIGVAGNVCSVADPAFLMEPMRPDGEMTIEEGAIGINLSPLMAKYVIGGDLERWTKVAAYIIVEVSKRTERQIYLIPHVTNPDSDDHVFMQGALSLVSEKNDNLTLVPPIYSAAEIKWIISQMTLFAGARTHSTIAALSSCVPTLSFAYSIKAQGINQDIFGHTEYCMDPKDLDAKKVADKITSMLDRDAEIRRDLQERIPEVQRSALNAGMKLRKLIGGN